MRPKPSGKIAVDKPQPPLGTLGGAFDKLDLPADLPPGPADIPARTAQAPTWKMGRVVLRREKEHRGGKTVIVVDDFATHLPDSVIATVAKRLRAACGCGGTVRGRTIEIQGDQPGKIRALLEEEGFQVAGVR